MWPPRTPSTLCATTTRCARATVVPGRGPSGCVRPRALLAFLLRRRLADLAHGEPVGGLAGGAHRVHLDDVHPGVGEAAPELVLVGDPAELDRGDVPDQRLDPLDHWRTP